MQPDNDAPGYCIWGVDNVVYGPVDLPTLVNWVRDERVTAALRRKARPCRGEHRDQLPMFPDA